MDPSGEIDRLLSDHKASLERHKKHEVWKLPNGNTFTRSKTPGSFASGWKHLADLKRALGITKVESSAGERREKKPKPVAQNARRSTATTDGALQEKLRLIGLAEASLVSQINDLNARLRNAERDMAACWGCRLRAWWSKLVKEGRAK